MGGVSGRRDARRWQVLAEDWAECAELWRTAFERQEMVTNLLWSYTEPEVRAEVLAILDQLDEIDALPERTT